LRASTLQFSLIVDALFGLAVEATVLGLAIDARVNGDLYGTLEEDMVDLLGGPGVVDLLVLRLE
jgi:hypothetical protein